ncbi:uncharacterized protein LOC115747081 isoform X2 [Rhodamnia argentea]|uniref:Uncharacterized protein LOC115747081 isoform X2 n=1 Tax=Rhodamnia argentea TaxID=178133 RepID=A0A8B8PW27_9MYRT|nr:uncharacterized protein LOC115747081 isoform X2 [Rhodamnia argentea]
MDSSARIRSFICSFWIFFLLFYGASGSAAEPTLVIGQSTSVQLSPVLLVENSPGSRPGTSLFCERVHIHGLSRMKHLSKIAHSVKVKILSNSSSLRPAKFEVCFHRNLSLGACMCPQNEWEKVGKGSWFRSMSPFDHKLLDIRVAGSSLETFELSIEEEYFLYRVVLLVMGLVLMTFASSLSNSLAFYYSSAMAVGIILVVLMVLFQGMRLLPTGRKNSLMIFIYSSLIGLGSFLLRYLPGLFHSILSELGISEDMYNPLAIFLLVFLVLTGAWLGFWVVRKLVLTEDGSVDVSTSHFVAWSIRVLAAVMILQCSLDPILALAALISGIATSYMIRRFGRLRFFRRLCRKLLSSPKDYGRTPRNSHVLHDSYDERGSRTPPTQPSGPEAYYSTFHTTPDGDRKRYSDDEWRKITKEYTKKSLEELVSSPDFSKWAVANAERITLAPINNNASTSWATRLRNLLPWT